MNPSSPNDGKKIKLLLVDDHPIFRKGIRAALERESLIRIVGEAGDGKEAVHKARRVNPDVVLMDITMPEMGGLEATRILSKTLPKAKVLILSMHENKGYILEMLRSGAKGYILKDSAPTELLRAIVTVNKGQSYFSSPVSQLLLDQYVKKPQGSPSTTRTELSQREKQVLSLIASGLSNKEIAKNLFLSVRTVETHREHIMSKLDIHNTAGLTRYAINNGLV